MCNKWFLKDREESIQEAGGSAIKTAKNKPTCQCSVDLFQSNAPGPTSCHTYSIWSNSCLLNSCHIVWHKQLLVKFVISEKWKMLHFVPVLRFWVVFLCRASEWEFVQLSICKCSQNYRSCSSSKKVKFKVVHCELRTPKVGGVESSSEQIKLQSIGDGRIDEILRQRTWNWQRRLYMLWGWREKFWIVESMEDITTAGAGEGPKTVIAVWKEQICLLEMLLENVLHEAVEFEY